MANQNAAHQRLSRITLLGVLAFGVLCSGWGNIMHVQASEQSRPNILFIMSDDHTYQAIGAYDDPRFKDLNITPTIDRLAKEGMVFQNVFCTNSICTPSRATILTGQYNHTNGVRGLYDGLPPDRQYLPRELNEAGYQTAMIGKWHLRHGPEAFDYYNVLPGQGRYHNPVLYTREGGEKRKIRFDSKLTRTVNARKYKGHVSDVVTDITLDWLKNKRDEDKPFLLMHHFKAPHDMFNHADRYNDYLEDVRIPHPEVGYEPEWGSIATRGKNDSQTDYIGSSIGKRNKVRNMGEHMGVDSSLPADEYWDKAYQRYLKRYLRCVKGIDDNLKRIVKYLDKAGMLENTIIVYTSDQGMFLGEHDFIDKRWMYEQSLRMPLIVRYPKMVKPGSENDWLINNTDFAPTLLELAGVDKPSYMQGRSFVKALRGEPEPDNWRDAHYYRYWMHMAHKHNNPAHFGIRTDRYKLIFFYGTDYRKKKNGNNRFRPDTPVAWELYDLKNDPGETKNIYQQMKGTGVVRKLKSKLANLRKRIGATEKEYPHIRKIIEKHWDD